MPKGGNVGVKGKEHCHRVNFLYQASELLAGVAPMLSQYYGQVLTTISEKTPAKIDFTMKRSMCKGCRTVLVPGTNGICRVKRRKGRRKASIVVKCGCCGKVKRMAGKRRKPLQFELSGSIEELS